MVILMFSSLLFGSAVFFLAETIARMKKTAEQKRALLGSRKRPIDSIFIGLFLPIACRVSPHISKVICRRYREFVAGMLTAAGIHQEMSADEFCAYQIVMALVLAVVVVFMPFGAPVLSCLIGGAVGLLFPLCWLRERKRTRTREILRELPFTLDMLVVSVSAGLDFVSAAARIAARPKKTLIVSELERMLDRMRLGKSRTDALAEFRERFRNPSIDSFVSMILAAERLGTPLKPMLSAHADKLRAERFQQAERAGLAAAEKMLVPLIFCIMPAVFIVIFGPLVVMWKNGAFERLFSI